MSEYTYIQAFYPTTLYPNKIWSSDYKYPIYFDEKEMGSKYIQVIIERGEDICVEDAYYVGGVAIDTPIYEQLPFDRIIVQPKMKCWGKGV